MHASNARTNTPESFARLANDDESPWTREDDGCAWMQTARAVTVKVTPPMTIRRHDASRWSTRGARATRARTAARFDFFLRASARSRLAIRDDRVIESSLIDVI